MFKVIRVGIFEAKAILGQLAQSAAAGDVVLLTKRGKPLAEIRAPQSAIIHADVQQSIDALRKFRVSLRSGEFDVAELVAEGRR